MFQCLKRYHQFLSVVYAWCEKECPWFIPSYKSVNVCLNVFIHFNAYMLCQKWRSETLQLQYLLWHVRIGPKIGIKYLDSNICHYFSSIVYDGLSRWQATILFMLAKGMHDEIWSLLFQWEVENVQVRLKMPIHYIGKLKIRIVWLLNWNVETDLFAYCIRNIKTCLHAYRLHFHKSCRFPHFDSILAFYSYAWVVYLSMYLLR